MKRILISGPAAEPVSIAEAKAHLRLGGEEDDALVGALIAAARVAVEIEIRQVLVAQGWRVSLDAWPSDRRVVLPIAPVLSVDAVRVFDADGAATLVPPGDIAVEGEVLTVRGASAALAPDVSAGGVAIDVTAGFGAAGAAVPASLRQAILMLVAHWYEHRSAVILGEGPTATPEGFRALVAPYWRLKLC